MHNLGHTRSSIKRDHILQTPDTFIRTVLPGMTNGYRHHPCRARAGAAFTQYTAELEPGRAHSALTSLQRFLYVTAGVADLATDTSFKTITAGSFAYIPPGLAHTLTAQEKTILAVVEKPYEPLEGTAPPALLIGHEDEGHVPPR